MKVIINHKTKPGTGKGLFVSRLVPELERLGVTVATDGKADIALHIGRRHREYKVDKNIIRVGPACVNSQMNWKQINREKWESVKGCDGVIYQSQYSKKVYHKLVGKPRCSEAVILNGADPGAYQSDAKFDGKCSVVCSTRKWLPQKRLKWIERAFIEAEIPGSVLYVCGNTLDKKRVGTMRVSDNREIVYLGELPQKELARVLSSSDMFVHLVYVDACPNSVAEALVANVPVICTDQGGTRELVEAVAAGGAVLPDKPFGYKPTNLGKPPKPDVRAVAAAMNLTARYWAVPESHPLHISAIAEQYVEFFQEVLDG